MRSPLQAAQVPGAATSLLANERVVSCLQIIPLFSLSPVLLAVLACVPQWCYTCCCCTIWTLLSSARRVLCAAGGPAAAATCKAPPAPPPAAGRQTDRQHEQHEGWSRTSVSTAQRLLTAAPAATSQGGRRHCSVLGMLLRQPAQQLAFFLYSTFSLAFLKSACSSAAQREAAESTRWPFPGQQAQQRPQRVRVCLPAWPRRSPHQVLPIPTTPTPVNPPLYASASRALPLHLRAPRTHLRHPHAPLAQRQQPRLCAHRLDVRPRQLVLRTVASAPATHEACFYYVCT